MIHPLSLMMSQVKKKCTFQGIRWYSFCYERHISSFIYVGIIWYYEDLRILSHTPVRSRMSSEHCLNEFIMFLSEFKYIYILDECFGNNSNLYRIELVHEGLSSDMPACQLCFCITIFVKFIS